RRAGRLAGGLLDALELLEALDVGVEGGADFLLLLPVLRQRALVDLQAVDRIDDFLGQMIRQRRGVRPVAIGLEARDLRLEATLALAQVGDVLLGELTGR